MPDRPPIALSTRSDAWPDARADAWPDVWSDVWLDGVEVRLAGDADRDGHHSRLIVTIDADTDGGHATVRAGIALVDGRGRIALAHDTGAFDVRGRAFADRTRVEFELLDDFPTGRYGLHVELRDARRGGALDGVGPNEFGSLGGLRLEDARRDGHGHGAGHLGVHPGVHGHLGGVRDDGFSSSFVATSYAGAVGPAGLAVLAAVALAALRRRRPGT